MGDYIEIANRFDLLGLVAVMSLGLATILSWGFLRQSGSASGREVRGSRCRWVKDADRLHEAQVVWVCKSCGSVAVSEEGRKPIPCSRSAEAATPPVYKAIG